MNCLPTFRSIIALFLPCLVISNGYADIVAHYPFDAEAPRADIAGAGLTIDIDGTWNGGSSSNLALAVAGSGSHAFARNPMNSSSGGFLSWTRTPPALLSTLADSFTISLWVKTVDQSG